MQHIFRKNLLIAVILCLTACSTTIEERGVKLDADKIRAIEIGKSSITDVAGMLGSPAATSNFGDLTWYYISQEMESWAFMKPKLNRQNVVIIRFDKSGIAQAVETKELKDAQDVAAVSKTTPSAESQLTILQQLLGNVGRFNGGEGTK